MPGDAGVKTTSCHGLSECGSYSCLGVDQNQWWDIQGYGPNIFVPMDCHARFPLSYNFPWLDAPCLSWHSQGPLCKWSFGNALTLVWTGLIYGFPQDFTSSIFQQRDQLWICYLILQYPKRPKACNSPGIRVLIQYGRFDAESQGSNDMDEVLSAVYASMRETCSTHGRLGCL